MFLKNTVFIGFNYMLSFSLLCWVTFMYTQHNCVYISYILRPRFANS